MSRKILVAVFATLALVLSVQAQSDLLTANKAEITTDPVFSYARVVNLVQWPEAAGGNDHWYGVLVEVLYWEEADSMSQLLELEGRSGYLATITSSAENEFILNSVIAGTSQSSVLDEFWLGGRDIGGEWIWMTGEPFEYTNWGPGEPNNVGIETALGMWGWRYGDPVNDPTRPPGTWNNSLPDESVHPLHKWWSVIEWGEPDHTEPPLVRMVQWPKSAGGNDHWYGVLPEVLYWEEADSVSRILEHEGHFGYLATVTSAAENDFILHNVISEISQSSILDEYWLGGRDIGGEWIWMTGEPFEYTNWGPGEPNNVGIETALGMWGWRYGDPINDPLRPPGTWNNSLPDESVHPLHKWWSVIEFGEPAPDEVIPTNEWINLYCHGPAIDGQYLEPGSEIRAFDPDGVLCGRGTVRLDGSFGFLNVYRDDPYTRRDEGARPGDVISFIINGIPAFHYPDVIWSENGDVIKACNFVRKTCLEIPLHAGWNLISWNIEYTAPVEETIAGIRDKIEVILSFDGEGQTFDPDLPEYSTLQTVDYFHGYWFKMDEPATLAICGQWAPHAKSINIYAGWNLVSYWPDIPLPTEIGLASVLDNVIVATGYDGQALTWMPGMHNFNTLTELKPLSGYWIKSIGPGNLIWTYGGLPAGNDRHTAPVARANDGLTASRTWIAMYGRDITLDGVELAAGTLVEAVTDNGQVCGRGQYDGDVLRFTAVYGRDNEDAATRAYPAEGEAVRVRVNGVETDIEIAWTENGARVFLAALTSTGNTDALPATFELSQNYPNPFNPATEIAFALPVASHVTVEIFNITGQKAALLVDERLEAGRHIVRWDAGGMASGVYLYRLRAGSFTATKKMVLLK